MNRHTPGPWIISNDTIGSNYGDIARLHYQSCRGLHSHHANANLIAACPDLLAMLEESTRLLGRVVPQSNDQRVKIRRQISLNESILNAAKGGGQ